MWEPCLESAILALPAACLVTLDKASARTELKEGVTDPEHATAGHSAAPAPAARPDTALAPAPAAGPSGGGCL